MAASTSKALQFTATRFSIAKLLSAVVIPLVQALPFSRDTYNVFTEAEEPPMSPDKPTLWIYLGVAVALVLLGGAFAGLTIALMGQDEIYLQVIKTSGEGREKSHAGRVLQLLNRGKHWVLVTLLLSNVITNETLPIVLDRSLGGGWPAVLGSTVLIVIFGEIIPQSICVRYGLPIGAMMSPLVLVLMYVLSPVAWPTAKLLDRLLGEDHGTIYKKAGLKTLVTLHKSLGADGEQLNSDEVTIISAVLDLKAKPVGDIMTPMGHVFTLSADTVLDEKTMEHILGAGYSRIPVHAPDNDQNFVGMLLVKILITYDPEDCKKVREFSLATLPETSPETSCLDIVNFFQEGKSHMVLVSANPGGDHGALGVVTLEDVIEELIGEEIIDESDVYIDVHKAIRRTNVAPRSKVPKSEVVPDLNEPSADGQEILVDASNDQKHRRESLQRKVTVDGHGHGVRANGELSASPKASREFLRRSSSNAPGSDHESMLRKLPKSALPDHFRHLGPSNPATRPRQTRYNTVKIKPGGGSFADSLPRPSETDTAQSEATSGQVELSGDTLSAAKDAKDGIQALQAEYGSIRSNSPSSPTKFRKAELATLEEQNVSPTHLSPNQDRGSRRKSRSASEDTVGSMKSGVKSPSHKRGTARSGSITENIVEAGGIRKTVLELTSSSSDHEGGEGVGVERTHSNGNVSSAKEDNLSQAKKKRRRKRRARGSKSDVGEDTPLLGRGR